MKITPTETPDALHFALRLTEVSRWGIVSTSRQQSVGEHSYRVCMIALALYDYMENGTSHNSHDRADIASFAMTHDLFEVLSGDLNSVFKSALAAQNPEVYEATVASMAAPRRDSSKLYHTIAGVERAAKNTIVECVVKIADLLEATIYNAAYGTNRALSSNVDAQLKWALVDYLQKCRDNALLPRYDWKRVGEFVAMISDTQYLALAAPYVNHYIEGRTEK